MAMFTVCPREHWLKKGGVVDVGLCVVGSFVFDDFGGD
jgi:hypothetical protein